MKVVFLDIDGVLNSYRTRAAHGEYPRGFAPEDMLMFDQTAISLIGAIVRAAGAKVVLSSAWRVTYSFINAAKAFDLPIIGSTPVFDASRGAQIKYWLDEHKSDVECYAIIDDEVDLLPEQMTFFVHTSPSNGFTFENALQLSVLMGVDLDGQVYE